MAFLLIFFLKMVYLNTSFSCDIWDELFDQGVCVNKQICCIPSEIRSIILDHSNNRKKIPYGFKYLNRHFYELYRVTESVKLKPYFLSTIILDQENHITAHCYEDVCNKLSYGIPRELNGQIMHKWNFINTFIFNTFKTDPNFHRLIQEINYKIYEYPSISKFETDVNQFPENSHIKRIYISNRSQLFNISPFSKVIASNSHLLSYLLYPLIYKMPHLEKIALEEAPDIRITIKPDTQMTINLSQYTCLCHLLVNNEIPKFPFVTKLTLKNGSVPSLYRYTKFFPNLTYIDLFECDTKINLEGLQYIKNLYLGNILLPKDFSKKGREIDNKAVIAIARNIPNEIFLKIFSYMSHQYSILKQLNKTWYEYGRSQSTLIVHNRFFNPMLPIIDSGISIEKSYYIEILEYMCNTSMPDLFPKIWDQIEGLSKIIFANDVGKKSHLRREISENITKIAENYLKEFPLKNSFHQYPINLSITHIIIEKDFEPYLIHHLSSLISKLPNIKEVDFLNDKKIPIQTNKDLTKFRSQHLHKNLCDCYFINPSKLLRNQRNDHELDIHRVNMFQHHKVMNFYRFPYITEIDFGLSYDFNLADYIYKFPSVTTLHINNQHHKTDLEGIQYLTRLTKLGFWGQDLKNLRCIQDLTALTSVEFWYHSNIKTKYLKELVNLTAIDLKTQDRDLSHFKKLTNVTKLSISALNIHGIEYLTLLNQLMLGNCPHSLEPIQNLTHLTRLIMSDCRRIENVSCLKNLTKLNEVSFNCNNHVEDLNGLRGIINLRKLEVNSFLKIRNIHSLQYMTNLRELKISNSHNLNSLGTVMLLTKLEKIQLNYLPNLTNLNDLASLTQVKSLRLNGNLNIININFLQGFNRLMELDLSGCAKIEDICHLSTLESLKKLSIPQCLRIPPEQVKILQQRVQVNTHVGGCSIQ